MMNKEVAPICSPLPLDKPHVFRGARLMPPIRTSPAPPNRALFRYAGHWSSPLEMVTGQEAYYIGKPNPLMMRTGLNMLGVHSNEAAIIGDRMDTDMVAGIESGLIPFWCCPASLPGRKWTGSPIVPV